MSDIPSPDDSQRFVTPKQLVEIPRYGWLSLSSLRHLLFEARPRVSSKGEAIQTNGLERAIIKVGRKVLIDREEFDAWVESHRLPTHEAETWIIRSVNDDYHYSQEKTSLDSSNVQRIKFVD